MGSIGVGTMGFVDLKACMSVPGTQVVAVCDVKSTMRERAKQAVDAHYGNKDCVTYNDFRELLDRRDIDAVTIATLDSWRSACLGRRPRRQGHLHRSPWA
jgi:predicted dehydrogenase